MERPDKSVRADESEHDDEDKLTQTRTYKDGDQFINTDEVFIT